MIVARRVYLFLTAYVALGVAVTGLAGLLAYAARQVLHSVVPLAGQVAWEDARGEVAQASAQALVGIIVWGLHLRLAWNLAARGDRATEERASALRKLYLYGVLLVGALIVLMNGIDAFGNAIVLTVGDAAGRVTAESLIDPLALMSVVGLLWLYHHRVIQTDRALIEEAGAGATLRRWFLYAFSFVALMFAANGAAALLETIWESLTLPLNSTVVGRFPQSLAIARAAATLGVGIAGWAIGWRATCAWLARANVADPETGSVLRKVYVYLVLGVGVTVTVWNAGRALDALLRATLRQAVGTPEWASLDPRLSEALPLALAFGLIWLYHGRVVQREAALARERDEQAEIRLQYGYLMSLIGGVAFAVGAAGSLATLLDVLIQPGQSAEAGIDRLSTYMTIFIVGLPLWAYQWRHLQREAVTLRAGALVRRVYLFIALGAAVLTLLFSGVFALYLALRGALGDPWSSANTTDILLAGCSAGVASLFLAYHLGVLRRDHARQSDTSGAAQERIQAVAFIHAIRPDDLRQWTRRLERSGGTVRVVPLDSARLAALEDQVPDATES